MYSLVKTILKDVTDEINLLNLTAVSVSSLMKGSRTQMHNNWTNIPAGGQHSL